MIYLPVSSSEALHLRAIEELREYDFEIFEYFVIQRLTKNLDLKPSVFKKNCFTLHYTSDEDVGDSGYHYRTLNDDDEAEHHRSGCFGFFHLPNRLKTYKFQCETSDTQPLTFTFMRKFHILSEFIMREENLRQEGIFLKVGSAEMQQKIRNALELSKFIDFDELGCTVHECADLLKQFLLQMPEPLFSTKYYAAYERVAKLAECLEREQSMRRRLLARTHNSLVPPDSELLVKEQQLLDCLQLFIQLMPQRRRELFAIIMDILEGVYKYRRFNRMNEIALAAVFAPLLICPRGLPCEVAFSACRHMSALISRMLLVGEEIFGAPLKFRLKIWKYFLHSPIATYV